MKDAQSRPRKEYIPKPKPVIEFGDTNEQSNGGFPQTSAPPARNAGKTCTQRMFTNTFQHSETWSRFRISIDRQRLCYTEKTTLVRERHIVLCVPAARWQGVMTPPVHVFVCLRLCACVCVGQTRWAAVSCSLRHPVTLFCVLFPLRHQPHTSSLAERHRGTPDCVSLRPYESVCVRMGKCMRLRALWVGRR